MQASKWVCDIKSTLCVGKVHSIYFSDILARFYSTLLSFGRNIAQEFFL